MVKTCISRLFINPLGDPPPLPRPIFPASGTALAITLETNTQVLAPLRPHQATVYSPSGLARHEGRRATGDHVRLILEMMVDQTRDLTDLLMVLDTIEYPTRPHPSLNPHVSLSNPRIVPPLSVAFLAHWVTRHLQAWLMVSGGRLPVCMPRPPPPIGPQSDVARTPEPSGPGVTTHALRTLRPPLDPRNHGPCVRLAANGNSAIEYIGHP